MGCDIHIIAEVKDEKGNWKKNTEKVFKNPHYREDEKAKPKGEQWDWALEEFEASPPGNRFYDWFSILADVRNGYGFAGVPTGEGFVPIAMPKGVPEDCCQEWTETVEEWGSDMDSHSFLSFKEFKEYDWSRKSTKSGIVTLDSYSELKGTNSAPESWSGGISGLQIVTVSSSVADSILSGECKEVSYNGKDVNVSDLKIYVDYMWSVRYDEWFEDKVKGVVEPLVELAKKFGDARIVFGFDN